MVDIPAERRLPFDTIRQELDEVLVACANKLDREWPTRLSTLEGVQPYFRGTVQLTEITYGTVRFLCADKPPNPARKMEFAESVPPLTRTILDSLFTVIFLLEDLPNRWTWFKKSGWREAEEEYQRLYAAHGTDPAWTEWLRRLQEDIVSFVKRESGVTAEEQTNPKLITWWPNPGKMPGQSGGWRKDYLLYLNDWFYRELSAESHLSFNGFGKRAGFLFAPTQADRERVLDKTRSDGVFTTVTLIISLLSEFEIEFRFGLDQKLKYLWGVIAEYWGAAKELYDRRYATTL